MDCSLPSSSVHGDKFLLSRQEYWSGLLFPSPGDLPNPGIKFATPALAGGFFTTESPEKHIEKYYVAIENNKVNLYVLQ